MFVEHMSTIDSYKEIFKELLQMKWIIYVNHMFLMMID